jgi:hypothetical protein
MLKSAGEQNRPGRSGRSRYSWARPIFADGRVHATFTQTGTAVGVPLDDPSLSTFTAKFTVWGGFNQNGATVNGTFTFNVRGTLSDGSTFSNQVNDHFNARPDGTVNEFFHCH